MLSEDILQEYCERWRLPGLAVCEFWNGEFRTLATGQISAKHLVPCASVTKTFTADLVLRYCGPEGLDDPICGELPDFKLQEPDRGRRLTLRDALSHASGLPPHTWAWVYSRESRSRFVRERLPHLPAGGNSCSRHGYSNILYAVLGEWLQAKTGLSWEDLLARDILEPLGLGQIRPLEEDWASYAPVPYARSAGGWNRLAPFAARKHHLIAPASELQGTVEDLARWGAYHLRHPTGDIRWMPHTLVTARRPHPAISPLYYGLGWRMDRVRGTRRVWHSGQCSGFTTLLTLQPERQRGLMLATPLSGATDALHAFDLRHLHGLELEDGPPAVPESGEPAGSSAPAGSLPEGVYEHPGYGSLELRNKGGELLGSYQGGPFHPLTVQEGSVRLCFPEYRVSVPVQARGQDELVLPLEPACTPIVFSRRCLFFA